jgi:hypothetical protein
MYGTFVSRIRVYTTRAKEGERLAQEHGRLRHLRSAWAFLTVLLLAAGSGSQPRVLAQQPHPWTPASPAVLALGSLVEADVSGNRESDPRSLPVATVHLQHQSVTLGGDGKPILDLAEGLGTVVGQHTILTHGHYRPLHDPAYAHEAMIVALQSTPISASVDMGWIDVPYADAGTILLVLPGWMRLPEAVPLGDPAQLSAGNPVSVMHWDGARGQSVLLETAISSVKGGVARIEDPGHALEPGDSGGAVYNARGELVGNVWSIGVSDAGQRLPWSEVALLPADVAKYVQ